MNATNTLSIMRGLIGSGDIEDVSERYILADYLMDQGRVEEANGLINPENKDFWLAGERLCWGEAKEWILVFGEAKGKYRYTVASEDLTWMDRCNLFSRDGSSIPKDATGVNMDDTFSKRYFLMAMQDCFDPLCAVVRASSEQDAVDYFTEELDWSHIPDEDIGDYFPDGEGVQYSPSGQACDLESLYMKEVKLVDAIHTSKLKS